MSRVGTNLTLEIQSAAPLLLTSLLAPDEGRRPQIAAKARCEQVTGRKHFVLLDVDSAMSGALCVHFCAAVFGPHLCPRILMSTFMHV